MDVRTRQISLCVLAVVILLVSVSCGGGGGGGTSEVSGSPSIASLPAAPGHLVALTLSGERIQLNWDDNANNETGYRIEKSSGVNQSYSSFVSVAAGIQTYIDTATASGTTFCYRVQAFNAYGASSYSNVACASKVSTALSPVIVSDGTGREWPDAFGKAIVTRWKGDKIAAYSLTIDDNCAPDIDWWRAQSSSYGFKFTWFVITGKIGGSSAGFYGTWDLYRMLAAEGHDIQSHTVAHNDGSLSILEEYVQSRQAIISNIPGAKAEVLAYPCGYPGYPGSSCGMANDMNTARQYYIAARGVVGHNNRIGSTDYFNVNSMGGFNLTDTTKRWCYLPDIHIYYAADPRNFGTWQNSLFHSVDSEATRTAIIAGLNYLKSHETDIWFGLFREVALYGQERETATVLVTKNTADEIRLTLTDLMTDSLFNYPLTIKVRLDESWTHLTASQNGMPVGVNLQLFNGVLFALIEAIPDAGPVTISKVQ